MSPSASLLLVDFSPTVSSNLRFSATHFYSLHCGFLSLSTIAMRPPKHIPIKNYLEQIEGFRAATFKNLYIYIYIYIYIYMLNAFSLMFGHVQADSVGRPHHVAEPDIQLGA